MEERERSALAGARSSLPATPQSGDGYRVLHVGDDPKIAWLEQDLLTGPTGLPLERFDRVTTRAAALAAVTDHGPYDVVLLDLHLPDSDDVQIVDHIVTHSPSSAVVVLTADHQPDAGIDALERGATHFLAKSQLDELDLAREIRFAAARKSYELRLRRMTRTDELTGLANRRGLADYHVLAQERVARDGGVIVLAYYDLNDFKPINDLFGHLVGDEVLRTVAQHLLHGVRTGDLVARLSGDEFVVVGLTADDAEASEFAGRLGALVRELPIGIGKATITAASGVVHSDETDSLDTILARADAAMYEDKRRLTEA